MANPDKAKVRDLEQRIIKKLREDRRSDREKRFEEVLRTIADGRGKYAKLAQETLED